jgi:CRISPR-associated protein Cmr5
MATLDQERAQLAFKHVASVKREKDESAQKKYASIVHSLPALLRSAGLCQSIAFVKSRSDENQKLLLRHFTEQLHRVDKKNIKKDEPDSLFKYALKAELVTYLRLTREAISCSSWYRRMVQGILKIEAGQDDE